MLAMLKHYAFAGFTSDPYRGSSDSVTDLQVACQDTATSLPPERNAMQLEENHGVLLNNKIAPTKFPQELVDIIIDHIHDDHETLRKCCLVHSSWTSICRFHLFSSVTFNDLFDLELWAEIFPSASESPARYVQSLSIAGLWALIFEDGFDPDELDENMLEHLRSFVRVQSLSLTALTIPLKSSWHHFDHMRSSLRSLQLYSPLPTKRSDLVDFVCSFPLLDNLLIMGSTNWVEEPYKCPSRPQNLPPLRGELRLVTFYDPNHDFITRLMEISNDIKFRTIQLDFHHRGPQHPVDRLLSACESTLEHLSLGSTFTRGLDQTPCVLNLNKNRVLRDLVLPIAAFKGFHCPWIKTLLSSLSSHPRLTIRLGFVSSAPISVQMEVNDWVSLDNILVEALDRGAVSKVVVQVAEELRIYLREGTLAFVETALSRLKARDTEFIATRGSVPHGLY